MTTMEEKNVAAEAKAEDIQEREEKEETKYVCYDDFAHDVQNEDEDEDEEDSYSEEAFAFLNDLEKKRRRRNALETLEVAVFVISLSAVWFSAGCLLGQAKGMRSGYSVGKIAGEHGVLSEYVRNRIWKAV